MIIRAARETDVRVLQAIEQDAAQRYASIAETRFCIDLSNRDATEHSAAREAGLALVVEQGTDAVGFLLAVPVDGRAHLLELAVRHEHQSRGYGRALIAAFEAWATDAGFAEATLTTFRDVPWNAPLYARIGYWIIDVGIDRPALMAVIDDERRAGVHRAPRVAMAKAL